MARAAVRLPPSPLVAAAGLAAALAAGPAATAQEPATAAPRAAASGRKYPPRVYQTVRLVGQPPSIDGRLDDEAWRQGEWSGDYTQQLPVEGAPPSQPTELKILYDDKHLYFAIRVFDDPAKVHRYPGRRDDFLGFAVDMVGICFDSYNDKRTGFEFDLTAGGSKIDLILGNGEDEWDTTWDAVWDGEVAHDERGWTAEVRIPLNQLRYSAAEEQVWGMHAWRWIARNQEEDQWQLIPRKNSGRMHQLGELRGIRDLPPSRHLELLPYALGRSSGGPAVPGDARDASGSAGLDLKLGLTSNFTLDATINPDFGQVEADPSVVNLTAYETFYEEKRPFFLEGRKILDFRIEDDDQLFYSRRIGQAPSREPKALPGETLSMPESTTILAAAKVTGKTAGGLSLGLLQSFTQREVARIESPLGAREPAVEPFGSYTVARAQKDWDKGNTILGGMLTATHRSISDPGLALLPSQAWSGGIDLVRYFAERAWLVEARGIASRVSGDRAAILALQTNPVHYFQREGASHLGVDPGATSLGGHGGSLGIGSTGKSRLHLSDQFHWYSPGLELNDVGYLRQADLQANELFVGWSEPQPRGPFRSYALELFRGDEWDFGGLRTRAVSQLEANASFRSKWSLAAQLTFEQVTDTRALRGGPALRWHDFFEAAAEVASDASRRVHARVGLEHAWSVDDDSWATELQAALRLRLSNRLSLTGQAGNERKTDNLQYVATADAAGEPRYVLGRIEQDTWTFTVRVNLALTPELTLQYYGSPFIGTGRYSELKRATDTLARDYADRFQLYGPDEITRVEGPGGGRYLVSEPGGARYSFADPDFSFRQFRSNLVARWEWKPGSSLYVVWSQGRTSDVPGWDASFSSNWDELWRTPSDNVFLVKFSYWFSP